MFVASPFAKYELFIGETLEYGCTAASATVQASNDLNFVLSFMFQPASHAFYSPDDAYVWLAVLCERYQ